MSKAGKRKIVNLSIVEFLEKRGKLKELVNMFGTVEYFGDYDYKKARVQ